MLQQTPAQIVVCPPFRSTPLSRLFGLGLLVAFGAMACEKVPLTAPTGTVITLVAGTAILPIDGSTDVVAVLIENGTTGTGTGGGGSTAAGTPVHNGTLVTFTTSLGRLEPSEARTTNGRATVKLVADGRSGVATVTAFSGSATQSIEVVVGAAAVSSVSVTASPSSLPSTGGQSLVTARVEDPFGNALAGVPVTFTTTAGTLSAKTALTNSAGFATTQLTTGSAAEVTASSGGVSGKAAITIRTRPTVTLTAPTGSLFVGSAATFTITPGTGSAMENVVIDYGDGTSRSLGAITAATTDVHYYKDDGVFQVTVKATDVDGATATASASIAVVPFSFSVAASPTSGTVHTIFTFTVSEIPTSVPIDRYVWNFGDGNVQTTTTRSITHGYQSPGLKTITVTVYPLYGDPKVATLQVQVTAAF